ncbi:hypothetical protein [Scytonema sp. NUACC26]|uniref:hypothetical protein n=1 Tax=Scytonema sp. NUACC26 TaxID=3140176 RepID=UPI0038B35730
MPQAMPARAIRERSPLGRETLLWRIRTTLCARHTLRERYQGCLTNRQSLIADAQSPIANAQSPTI